MKMKIARVSLLLFLSVAILLGLANASDKPEPVLDTDGDEVRTGVEYFVVSAIWGAGGGGLAIGRSSKQPCPEIVVQNGRDIDNGIPVIFYNAYSSDGIVRLDTDVNIEFLPIRDRLCLTSTVWKLDNYDESMGKWWVTTDGDIGNPGPSTLKNWFKIDKFTVIGYQFSFCPSVCYSCVTLCNNITRDFSDGELRLALTKDQGWPWIFRKATRSITQDEKDSNSGPLQQ
ncbi:Proteinase inhibitor I3, Kunitz legume [Corchorus olitorius]|uniref:Proteinase inhibitor I3, Kunitz legume n=1 Tax=Corchorus olitorius TaxID=93759 RepID=A0A1R3HC90_9ROSI|nr:Proteinase inhibitor I3, Kunitz legume [Corchorus olitorius]